MVCRDDTLLRRLTAKTTKTETCWFWTGAKDRHGYGEIGYSRGMQQTHRVAYGLFVGPIPKGLHILHRCDNPSCINPAHLFAGTAVDNMRDMRVKGRSPNFAGALNGSAKLGDSSVRVIRSSPLSTRSLSEMFGMSLRAIQNVRSHKTWKHV